jgi:hypothetical protein
LVDWDYISKYQNLSESFIEEHKDLVYWICISKYQKLSESFIEEHKDVVCVQESRVHQPSEKIKRDPAIIFVTRCGMISGRK